MKCYGLCESADLCIQKKSHGELVAGVHSVPGLCHNAILLVAGTEAGSVPGCSPAPLPLHDAAGHSENLASHLTCYHTWDEFARLSALRQQGSSHLSSGTYKLGLSGGSLQCRFWGIEARPGSRQPPAWGECRQGQGSPSPWRKPLLKQLQ